MKRRIAFILSSIALCTLAIRLSTTAMDAEFIQDSHDILEKASINQPTQEGIAVHTLAGEQLTPATAMPSEVISNAQVFNDIARLRAQYEKLKQVIIELEGRYDDYAGDFEVINVQFGHYIQQIENELKTKLSQ